MTGNFSDFVDTALGCCLQGRIRDFPVGSGHQPSLGWGGRQPPTQGLFGENVCQNERIEIGWETRNFGVQNCRCCYHQIQYHNKPIYLSPFLGGKLGLVPS